MHTDPGVPSVHCGHLGNTGNKVCKWTGDLKDLCKTNRWLQDDLRSNLRKNFSTNSIVCVGFIIFL